MKRTKGKALRPVLAKLDFAKKMSVDEALQRLREVPPAKFDETVEVALNLGIDTSHGDQMVRGTVSLPHGTGKVPRVAVFAGGEAGKQAREAGADEVGAEDLVEKIEQGWDAFDVLVATPDMMRIASRLGKKLGPRMPSKKAGTITTEIVRTVRELKSGRVEYRADKGGVVHVPIGKLSFPDERLRDNFLYLLGEIVRARPATVKGVYLKKISLSTTMGPGVKVDVPSARAMLEQTRL